MPNYPRCQVVPTSSARDMAGRCKAKARQLLCETLSAQVQSSFVLMRKAALLYNPGSGGSKRRQRELESALTILKTGGVEAELFPTESPRHAADIARRAIADGCDSVFACGGDGTINNIAQVLANSPVALAILPMGTANALAHDLGLPMKVPAAAKAALTAMPKRVALGHVTCLDLNGANVARYFVVAAGVGVDAHLFYKLHTGTKQRLGMAAYYAKAWNLWFTYAMPRFRVNYLEAGESSLQSADVTELLAVRIRQFGGVIRELARGASLDRDDARLILCRTGSRLAYLAFVALRLCGLAWTIPGIDLAFSANATCSYLPISSASAMAHRIYVEADGELIGCLPAEIRVVPNALTLLAPPR